MKNIRFVCTLLGLSLFFSIQAGMQRHKERIQVKERRMPQTRSPHEPFFDIYTLYGKSLEINSRENMQATLRIENIQGETVYINVVYLDSTLPTIINLNYASEGTYTLYLYNDYVEAEGTFHLNNEN